MRLKTKLPPRTFFLWVSVINFLIYYLMNLFLWEYDVAFYASRFISEFFEIALPVSMAAVLYRQKNSLNKFSKITLYALTIALTRSVYFFLYYYLYYVNGVYDSIEAVALSLLTTAAAVLFLTLKVLLFFTIIKITANKTKSDNAEVFPVNFFDLNNPASFGILISSGVSFLIYLGFEIYETVAFFIDVGMSYRANEIILIIVSYVFLIVAFLLTYLFSCFSANSAKTKT